MPVRIGRQVVETVPASVEMPWTRGEECPQLIAPNASAWSGPPTSPAVPRIPVSEEGFNGPATDARQRATPETTSLGRNPVQELPQRPV